MLICKECKAMLEEHTVKGIKIFLCSSCGCNYDSNESLINKRNKEVSEEENYDNIIEGMIE